MTTRRVIASYAVELTERENGSLWITVTPPGSCGASFAQPVTATYLGILETTQKLSSELLTISRSHRRSRY